MVLFDGAGVEKKVVQVEIFLEWFLVLVHKMALGHLFDVQGPNSFIMKNILSLLDLWIESLYTA